jgi:hypothetical protein
MKWNAPRRKNSRSRLLVEYMETLNAPLKGYGTLNVTIALETVVDWDIATLENAYVTRVPIKIPKVDAVVRTQIKKTVYTSMETSNM